EILLQPRRLVLCVADLLQRRLQRGPKFRARRPIARFGLSTCLGGHTIQLLKELIDALGVDGAHGISGERARSGRRCNTYATPLTVFRSSCSLAFGFL